MPERIDTEGQRVPILSWLPKAEIDDAAMRQLSAAASHPDVAAPVAVMPDCHVGYGVTIGCVLATDGALVPAAVGVDIACGVRALDTGLEFTGTRASRNFWERWADRVRQRVPTGFSSHGSPQRWEGLSVDLAAKDLQPLVRDKAAFQLGTLGGGNHFLEAQVDERNRIWLMAHSGSRHLGLRIAERYAEGAERLTRKRGLAVPPDLWSLPTGDDVAHDYLRDMAWAEAFARESRRRMMDAMLEALRSDADPAKAIDVHHNFARLETHGGRELVVHRKGATSAAAGETVIIPGSMGSPSHIVRGRGNPESLLSCSHGAGRRMGRNQAKAAISDADFRRSLAGTFSAPSRGYADEAPQAYKDIDRVMARQDDLVEVVHRLRPIITVKGDSKARED